MLRSGLTPPSPSPSPSSPPGPDPSEGAMALEPVRLYLLSDAPSSRPQSPTLSPEPETSEMTEKPSAESSDSPPTAEPTAIEVEDSGDEDGAEERDMPVNFPDCWACGPRVASP
ncbi:hypothetical protein E4U56_003374 [Claviceps arundinis]|uniref:Uncharacterized protein n=1 Tax=Claviceps arundinis TaxID=1623583 RepID=A0A9P7MPN5_9HYPO|nr:hypothetical protein E4U56_003374 [Claviceps arundinis]